MSRPFRLISCRPQAPYASPAWRLRLRAVTLLLSALMAPGRLDAQVVERPVPFDSAGRVRTMTPPLAARLGIAPPVWPITGDYTEARLFALTDGAFAIVVQRKSGDVERWPMTQDGVSALARAIAAASVRTGALTTLEQADVISEPARGAFVRNQMLAALIIYAPAAAALPGNPAAGSALYLATIGGAFMTTLGISRNTTVTRAQNQLATDGAWRGAGIGWGLAYIARGADLNGKASAGGLLIGGLGGATLGYRAGRPLTDGEARGATFGSTLALLTTAGVIGMTGGYKLDEQRGEVAGLIAATVAGLPLGVRHVRRAGFGITSGDVGATAVAANLGVLAAAAIVADDAANSRVVFGGLTAGLLAGAVFGDRKLARLYDYTEGEAALLGLGALAGALIGLAPAALAQSENGHVTLGLAAGGAILGAVATHNTLKPRPAAPRAAAPARGDGRAGAPVGRASLGNAGPKSRVAVRSSPSLVLLPHNLPLLMARPKQASVVPLARVTF